MVSHYPVKFDDHSHCDSGDTYLVVEEHDSTCSRLNTTFLFTSRAHDMKTNEMPYQQVRSWTHVIGDELCNIGEKTFASRN